MPERLVGQGLREAIWTEGQAAPLGAALASLESGAGGHDRATAGGRERRQHRLETGDVAHEAVDSIVAGRSIVGDIGGVVGQQVVGALGQFQERRRGDRRLEDHLRAGLQTRDTLGAQALISRLRPGDRGGDLVAGVRQGLRDPEPAEGAAPGEQDLRHVRLRGQDRSRHAPRSRQG